MHSSPEIVLTILHNISDVCACISNVPNVSAPMVDFPLVVVSYAASSAYSTIAGFLLVAVSYAVSLIGL